MVGMVEWTQSTVLSRDGTEIGIVDYIPRTQRGPGILFVPALGVPIGYYSLMLQQWASRGRRIVAVELRGMPLSPVTDLRGQRFGYGTLFGEDLPAVVAAAVPDPYFIVGHSLGGQLALLGTASGAVNPAGIVAIASGTSSRAAHSGALRRAVRIGQVMFVRATSAALGFWPGDRVGFGGRQPRSLMRDWYHEGRHGHYRIHGDDTDYVAALRSLDVPITLLSLDGDTIVPHAATAHLAAQLPPATAHVLISKGTGFDHIRWARREPGVIIDEVERALSGVGLP